MSQAPLQLFALNTSRVFGDEVSSALGQALSPHEEREFEDGEHKARPLANVRGRDVYVLQSLHGDGTQSVNDKLCRLLFFVGALRDAAAGRITAVLPYLAYARKDTRTNPRDPVTLRYVAAMFEAAGTDTVLTLDVHNVSAFQNAFRCRTDHLDACQLFAGHFAPLVQGTEVVAVSPDSGGVKRANLFRKCLAARLNAQVGMAYCEKYRRADTLSGELLVGDVRGKTVIIYDDLISSGQTTARAARLCRQQGASKVYAAASHALFQPGAAELLGNAGIDAIVVTDSGGPWRPGQSLPPRLSVVSCAPLFAQAIRRMHEDGSVSDLVAW
ncbi:ribose-phosphate diphosphokinase [Massilia horti]|uniref:Ribose-phosphate pyrophosphokinase n=1 Tax=Massilia horti TaxID=2562153 RepID=A0A4Y9SXY9_9BURK|nr:ribose-phosphate pyrophosphokinase [Massilia horti]TFW31299.1 ribose-phosphate pyrophosphokinase [Massilia horti]